MRTRQNLPIDKLCFNYNSFFFIIQWMYCCILAQIWFKKTEKIYEWSRWLWIFVIISLLDKPGYSQDGLCSCMYLSMNSFLVCLLIFYAAKIVMSDITGSRCFAYGMQPILNEMKVPVDCVLAYYFGWK